MVLYSTGNFQIFKEDLALWVALVYDTSLVNDTRSNNSQYNNAQFMYIEIIYLSLHIIIHAYIIYLSLHDIDTVYIPKYSMK